MENRLHSKCGGFCEKVEEQGNICIPEESSVYRCPSQIKILTEQCPMWIDPVLELHLIITLIVSNLA
jgi:hypothetical protein